MNGFIFLCTSLINRLHVAGCMFGDYLFVDCVIFSCARGTQSICKHKIHQTYNRHFEVHSLSLFLEVPEVVTAIRKNLCEKIGHKSVRLHTQELVIDRRLRCVLQVRCHANATTLHRDRSLPADLITGHCEVEKAVLVQSITCL